MDEIRRSSGVEPGASAGEALVSGGYGPPRSLVRTRGGVRNELRDARVLYTLSGRSKMFERWSGKV